MSVRAGLVRVCLRLVSALIAMCGVCVCVAFLWERKGPHGEENQTHPELFIRHCSHHRCSHRHSVWVVGRGVWRASMASIDLFLDCVRIIICRPAVCVNGDSAVIF